MKTKESKKSLLKRFGVEPDIRRLHDMERPLYDKKWTKTALDYELYYMYRGVKEKDGLRYDVTVFPPLMLGKEFIKTKGHEHIGNFGEIYIVLRGKAIFLAQKRINKKIEDVFAVKAEKGQVILIPAGYGHITINPSKKILETGNWQKKECRSDYKPFDKMNGACYYYTNKGWVKNKLYKDIPVLRFVKPLNSLPKNLKNYL
jgi:glucose-6-phosphate isomerase, archaeal